MPTVHESSQPRGTVSRRDFLAVGGLSVVGLSVAEEAAVQRARERSGSRSCILIVMTGGPSQLETFDPKPDAPRETRGPLKAIQTSIPGVRFSEGFPRLAERADQLTVIRSVYHDAAPIHETGLQLLQTGRLARGGIASPSVGAMLARLLGPRGSAPPYVVLPQRLSETGVAMYRGDGAGFLGELFEPARVGSGQSDGHHAAPAEDAGTAGAPEVPLSPFERQSVETREAYGDTPLGRRLLQARQLIEQGVRFVTVHTTDRLNGCVSWDAHAERPEAPTTLFDYRDSIGPQFDRACAALLDDLRQRGLFEETLVICAGEFGRSPRLNDHGGRDHWPRAGSAIAAGCGLPQGGVLGASDAHGAEPIDRPVALPELTATIYEALRVDRRCELPDAWPITSLCESDPIAELIG